MKQSKIKYWFRKIYIHVISWFTGLGIRIGVSLLAVDKEIFGSHFTRINDSKYNQRKRHRLQFIENFYAGIHDEKYIKYYYELLKKADKFKREANPHKMEVAAYKYGLSYGMKDKWGRRYEHYGFFDEKHKYAGKTLGEVIQLELEERRTKDDDFEILFIFDNKPQIVGLSGIDKIVDGDLSEAEEKELKVIDQLKQSKTLKFPLKVVRNNKEVLNKIEELTESLHIKKVGFEYRQLEFFIPKKFKVQDLPENDKIFKEIIDIDQVRFDTEYNELVSFKIIHYIKRIEHDDYCVLKFYGKEMKIIRNNLI